jgi:hypothetical protein
LTAARVPPDDVASPNSLSGTHAELDFLGGAVRVARDAGVDRRRATGMQTYRRHFKASVVPPPDCTAAPLLCTAGRVWGGLQAEYAFTMSSAQPADPSMPSMNFFTGRSTITVKKGETLEAFDAGTIDFQAGGFVH